MPFDAMAELVVSAGEPGAPSLAQRTLALFFQPSAEPSSKNTTAPDALLACLQHLASLYHKPYSAPAVLHGLPLDDHDRLTPQLFPRAAARLGILAEMSARQPSEVSDLLLPAVIMLADGDAGVLLKRGSRGRRVQVLLPASSVRPRWIDAKDLETAATGHVFFVANEADASEVALTSAATKSGRQRKHWFWHPIRRLWPTWLQIATAAFLINLLGL